MTKEWGKIALFSFFYYNDIKGKRMKKIVIAIVLLVGLGALVGFMVMRNNQLEQMTQQHVANSQSALENIEA